MADLKQISLKIALEGAGDVVSGLDRVKGKAGEVSTGIGRMAESARQTEGRMGSSFSAMETAAKSLVAAFGGLKLAQDFLDVNKRFDALNASLITVTGSSAAAGLAFESLQKFATETPYHLDEVVQSFIKMKALGLDASEAALKSYGNTASAMGKSLDQMIEAVADAATGEFERLKEFGIKARQNGDQVTLTFRGVATTIGNNAADIEEYLRRIGEIEFAGGMSRQMNTLGGRISNLSDAWDSLMRTFGDVGGNSIAISAVVKLTGKIQDLDNAIKFLSGSLTDLKKAAGGIGDLIPDLGEFGDFLSNSSLLSYLSTQQKLREITKDYSGIKIKMPTAPESPNINNGSTSSDRDLEKLAKAASARYQAEIKALEYQLDLSSDIKLNLTLDTTAADESSAQWQRRFSVLGDQAKNTNFSLLDMAGTLHNELTDGLKLFDENFDPEEWERQSKAMDRYRNMLEGLRTDEERLSDQLRERLDLLAQIKDVSATERTTTINRIIDEGFASAPGMEAGLSEADKLEQESSALENWYSRQLELLEQYRQERSDLNDQWDRKELELKRAHAEQAQQIEAAQYMLLLNSAGTTFGNIAEMTKNFAGEQSNTYKAMFAVSKAFAIAEASIKLWQAIAIAGASTTWPANLAAMVSVAAAMGGLVANIASVGMAHDGIDSVPKSGTWILEKGERVITEKTSAKLDKTLDNVQTGKQPMTVNIHNAPAGTAAVQSDDGQSIDVYVAEVERAVIKRMDRGTGLAGYMDRRYGRRA